jgi:hypothetical protein
MDLSHAARQKQRSGSMPAPAFLEKLYEILSEEAGNQEYIAWQPNGTAFLIKQPLESFCNVVLPKYFKHNNLQSFIRQLNMYDFTKTSHDSNHREFTHALFRKGRRDLLCRIKRKVSGSRLIANISKGNVIEEDGTNYYSASSPHLLAEAGSRLPSFDMEVAVGNQDWSLAQTPANNHSIP